MYYLSRYCFKDMFLEYLLCKVCSIASWTRELCRVLTTARSTTVRITCNTIKSLLNSVARLSSPRSRWTKSSTTERIIAIRWCTVSFNQGYDIYLAGRVLGAVCLSDTSLSPDPSNLSLLTALDSDVATSCSASFKDFVHHLSFAQWAFTQHGDGLAADLEVYIHRDIYHHSVSIEFASVGAHGPKRLA